MKILLSLLSLFAISSLNASQEFAQWGLPDGVKARLGKGAVSQIQYSPDGTRLAVGSGIGIWLYDTTTHQEVDLLTGHSGVVPYVAFSPDGSILASVSSDSTVRLWDAATGKHMRTLEGHTLYVTSIAFSPDGSTLASGSRSNPVRLWDAVTGAYKQSLGLARTNSVAFSPDGRTLATGSDYHSVELWNVKTGRRLRTLQNDDGRDHSIAFSPDGKTLASWNGETSIRLWNANEGAVLRTLHWDPSEIAHIVYRPARSTLAFSPDGAILASGSLDATIRLWDVSTGTHQRTLKGHTADITSVVFSPGGNMYGKWKWRSYCPYLECCHRGEPLGSGATYIARHCSRL
jgi:WD40 repeat protein